MVKDKKEYEPNWVSPTIYPLAVIPVKEHTKEEKKRARRLKKNPNKGSLRDYRFIDLLCNTWEGVLTYTLPGIFSFIMLIFRIDFSSWTAIFETTLKSPLWILSLILLFPFTFSALKYWVIWFSILAFENDIDNIPKVIYKIGIIRQGKTSSMNYEAVVAARKMWDDLRITYAEYNLKYGKRKRSEFSIEEWNDWMEVKTSYEYCVNSDCVPLLWSTSPIMVNGRYSNVLTKEHIAGRKKLPFKVVMVLDELTRFMDSGKSGQQNEKKDWDVSNMFALEGHFLGSIIYMASQDENGFLDAVRSCSYTEIMNKQSPACKPFWLTAFKRFFYLLLKEANRKKPKKARIRMSIYIFLRNYWNRVGFRKYDAYRRANRSGNNNYYGSKDEKGVKKSRHRTFYLPARLNCIYDDRTFRELYPSYFKETIEGEGWKSLRMSSGSSFLSATKSEFERKFEKKQVDLMVNEAIKIYKGKKKNAKSNKKKS